MSRAFHIDSLRNRLLQYPEVQTYLVGFSGGIDSTALMHALHSLAPELPANIRAIHFNHGLNPSSAAWAKHCHEFCRQRSIELDVENLALNPDNPGLEARARTLRYAAVEQRIDANTLYLTAHNLDDRAETFLLHALRGSGVDGLASIPELRPLGGGFVARPLLDQSRASLRQYLIEQNIPWVEDPTNQDSRFDRNFIRNEVLPLLESRWPAARTGLGRSAQHLRTAASTLDTLLGDALESGTSGLETLAVKDLFRHGNYAASMILRAWLKGRSAPPIPEERLESLLAQVEAARPDARCEVAWAGWAMRLFRGNLHLLQPGDQPPCPALKWFEQALDLGPRLGSIEIVGSNAKPPRHWQVGPRQPGARIRLHAGGPARKLKKVMQEQPIPPWQRQSIPVLYWDEEAVALGDWMTAPRLAEWLDRSRLMLRWTPADPSLSNTQQLCRERNQAPGA